MAWIESHTDLLTHYKVLELQDLMGWSLDETIGKLHRLWWWCVDHARDGDLRKHNDNRIAIAMGVTMQDSTRLVEALVKACWLDREPYFRVNDWLNYFGFFLRRSSPEMFEHVKRLYYNCTVTVQNCTEPNLDREKEKTLKKVKKHKTEVQIPSDLLEIKKEILNWLEYKREKGQTYKPKGISALFSDLRRIPREKRAESINFSMASNYSGIFEKKGQSSQSSDAAWLYEFRKKNGRCTICGTVLKLENGLKLCPKCEPSKSVEMPLRISLNKISNEDFNQKVENEN